MLVYWLYLIARVLTIPVLVHWQYLSASVLTYFQAKWCQLCTKELIVKCVQQEASPVLRTKIVWVVYVPGHLLWRCTLFVSLCGEPVAIFCRSRRRPCLVPCSSVIHDEGLECHFNTVERRLSERQSSETSNIRTHISSFYVQTTKNQRYFTQ